MPIYISRLLALSVIVIGSLVLAGCGNDQKRQRWDGEWVRQIAVPKDMAGRCVDEVLHIRRGAWRLSATVYATYRCDSPTVELVYEGVLGKVAIAREAPTLDAEITVDSLKLAKVANISRGKHDYLSPDAVHQLSSIYLGATTQTRMVISIAGDSLAAPVFEPLWSVAYSDAPYQSVLKIYTRAADKK